MDLTPEAPAEDQGGSGLWSFANVEFDERSLELRVAGQLVEMERKSLEVLRQLLYRAGEVATKEELLEAVWPGRILSETVLAKCISRIRQVLGDDDQQIVKTVHGYGYRLIADVKVQLARSTLPAPQLKLAAGDSPPLRPEWKLVKRLGAGGQGEVWLCKHEKLGSQRVLKFALEESGLAAIKREITLHRLLRDALGERADLCNVIDWNLKEPPFFIELEHAADGNLEEWAATQGGLANVPLATRIDIVVRIADVLAATHSVGVLHKDLKPTNVLMGTLNGVPQPRLTDFGSGGLVDPLRLEALGITRMGFTKSVFAGNAEATPLYRAPELMTGQPATVQADIFSLGVMLYQMVIGNLRQPLAPGWEREVEDPMLREDIALAVAGDRGHRLTDVATIAQRLRSLEQRRAERQRQLDEQARIAVEKAATEARARQAELTVERLKARRNWMLTSLAVLIVGLALSVGLWADARRARNEARIAAESSQAVADFLSRDMFAQVGERPLRSLSVKDWLETAADTLNRRPNVSPLALADIHAALGRALLTMDLFPEAEAHLSAALDGYRNLDGFDMATAVAVAAPLASVKYILGQAPEQFAALEGLAQEAEAKLGRAHPALLQLKQHLGYERLKVGDVAGAGMIFSELVAVAKTAEPVDRNALAELQRFLGHDLLLQGRFQEALSTFDDSIRNFSVRPNAPPMSIATAGLLRAQTLVELERFDEARAALAQARSQIQGWALNDRNTQLLVIQFLEGQLASREGLHDEAISRLERAVQALAEAGFEAQNAEPRRWLALALQEAGRLDTAESMMQKARAAAERTFGVSTPWYQLTLVGLADIERARGKIGEATSTLSSIEPRVFERLNPDNPFEADWRRVDGLTARAEGRLAEAQALLTRSASIIKARYGSQHRLTRRAEAELAGISVTAELPAGAGEPR